MNADRHKVRLPFGLVLVLCEFLVLCLLIQPTSGFGSKLDATRCPLQSAWLEIPPLPIPITNNAVAAAQVAGRHYVFSFLGVDRSLKYSGITRRAFAYETISKKWEEIRPIPGVFGRLAATAQAVKEKVYIFGGYTVDEKGSEFTMPNVNIYDPLTNTYQRGADIPVPVDDAVSGVWHDRYIYLISGWSQKDNVHHIQVYDTQKNTWSQATPLPGPGRFGHSGGILGDTIIVVDGVITRQEKPKFVMEPTCYLGKIDPKNPLNITWTPIPQHPGAPRYRMAAGTLSNKQVDRDRMYFSGGTENPYNYNGIGYDGKPSQPTGTTFALNTRTNEWETLPPNPVETMDHRGFVSLGNTLFLVGGIGTGPKVRSGVQALQINR